MSVRCKKCGIEWKDKNEIVESTMAEHDKILGHRPVFTDGR